MGISAAKAQAVIDRKHKELGGVDGVLELRYFDLAATSDASLGLPPASSEAGTLTLTKSAALIRAPSMYGQTAMVNPDELRFLVAQSVFAKAGWSIEDTERHLNDPMSRIRYHGKDLVIKDSPKQFMLAGQPTEWLIVTEGKAHD